MTHICISKLTTINSDNGLSPGRHQVIIWANARWNIVNSNFRNKLQWNLKRNSYIFTKKYIEKNTLKWRPLCLGLNVLTLDPWIKLIRFDKRGTKVITRHTLNITLFRLGSTIIFHGLNVLAQRETPKNLLTQFSYWGPSWCHHRETHHWPFSMGIHQPSVDSPHRARITQSFNACFFDVGLNKLLKDQSSCRWFQMSWRSCDATLMWTVWPLLCWKYSKKLYLKSYSSRFEWILVSLWFSLWQLNTAHGLYFVWNGAGPF